MKPLFLTFSLTFNFAGPHNPSTPAPTPSKKSSRVQNIFTPKRNKESHHKVNQRHSNFNLYNKSSMDFALQAYGIMEGAPLTMEGVCQVYQLVEYLAREHNIKTEGIFRKHGNLKKQTALKERLNKG